MKVALTTGNNIYYSRLLTSIYLHSELFESDDSLEIIKLQEEKKQAVKNEEYGLAEKLNNRIKELELNQEDVEVYPDGSTWATLPSRRG